MGPVPAATLCLPLLLLGPLLPAIPPFFAGLTLILSAESTFSSSSSVFPYRASRVLSKSESEAEDTEDFLRIRERRGA
jgi:hypothetical protein